MEIITLSPAMLSFNIHIQLEILIRLLKVMLEAGFSIHLFWEWFFFNQFWSKWTMSDCESMRYGLGLIGCVKLCECFSVYSPVCAQNRCPSPQTEYYVAPVWACQNTLCYSALPALEGLPGWPHLLPLHLVRAQKEAQLHNQLLIFLKITH